MTLDALVASCAEFWPRSGDLPNIVAIGRNHALTTCIVLVGGDRRAVAHLEAGADRGRVLLYRVGAPPGAVRTVAADEEKLLSARERFSVAHELGHWLAWTRYGIPPEEPRTSAYWKQERVMNEFASRVLVPDAAIAKPLQSREGTTFDPRWLGDVSRWMRVSIEVLAHAICRQRDDVGFVRVRTTVRRSDRRPVLRVQFEQSGSGVTLPKIHSHLPDAALADALARSPRGHALASTLGFRGTPPLVRWTSQATDSDLSAWLSFGPVHGRSDSLNAAGPASSTNSEPA